MRGLFWRRLFLGIGGLGAQFQCLLFLLVQAQIFGAHAGGMTRALGMLSGGLGRSMPCSIGANHCRLRHMGWEKCGHVLTSRPRESSSVHVLDELLVLFGYPSKSGAALLEGTLPLRYCTSRFARKVPTWRLPVAGKVAGLLTGNGEEAGSACAAPSVHAPGGSMVLGCVHGGGGSDSGEKTQLMRLFRVWKGFNLARVSERG